MELTKAYICQHQEFKIWKLWSKVKFDDMIFGFWYSETPKPYQNSCY